MIRTLPRVIALVAVLTVVFTANIAAQDLSQYRGYTLESSVETVVTRSGMRPDEVKTLHQRPAVIQQLEWRAPYVAPDDPEADPVQDILFSFYNGALYQVAVNYRRGRTEGLTNGDVVASIAAAYGPPVARGTTPRTSIPAGGMPDGLALARWESDASRMMLLRSPYSHEFQLVLTAPTLGDRALSATREAVRMDAVEAPRREAERLKQDASDARDASDRTRATNKSAFRP